MDFDQAVSAHSTWKRQFRLRLQNHDGSLSLADVSIDYKCDLGQWIHGEGATYSSLPEYTKLKYEHARFHTLVAAVIRKANAGDSVGDLLQPCSNSEFSAASSAVVLAILAMKKRVLG
jgi:methyl-accepting chemotaxis protein